jgi:leucyl-tRNA synthetase
MFLGPLEAMKTWNTSGIEGIVRFLRRVWREIINREGQLSEKFYEREEQDGKTLKLLHETIRKVSEDIENLQFNTAISQLMILLNRFQEVEKLSKQTIQIFIQLLAPFAPHIGEELWKRTGRNPSVSDAPWPVFDPAKLIESTQKIIIQVNGKMRGEVVVPKNCLQAQVIKMALEDPKVQFFLEKKPIAKEIYVPGKILNLVVK